MQANYVNFTINIDGNAYKGVLELNDAVEKVTSSVESATSGFKKLGANALRFDVITNSINKISQGLNDTIQPGIALNASLQDLSAITGVTGKGLKEIEGYARQTAKTFGVDAAQAVESYKLVLGQLNPEIAKSPKALKDMGESIAVLSKTMGGDTVAAAEVLNTAMNQFQVSLEDPIKASEEMARMMNIMAEAAREGSAELPQIKAALEQCGMAAKGANVSFEEVNAAIQVLDKAGKRGAEGGVALRNVMNILARGRFLPKNVKEELQAAGVNINILGDKTRSLTERLRPLKSVMHDSALFSKLFGMENTNAAIALISSIDEVDEYTRSITGTNTAYEQAEIVMESYAEKQARIKAQFDDFKISIFNATGDFGIWVQVIASSLVPLAQLSPLFIGIGKSIRWCTRSWGGFVKSIKVGVLTASLRLGVLKNSIALAGGMFQFLRVTATSACRGIGVAIMSIPIIGWIAAIIALLIAVFRKLWNKSEGFRNFVKKAVNWISEKFGVFAGVIKKYFVEPIAKAFMWLKDLVHKIFGRIKEVYDKSIGRIVDKIAGLFKSSEYQDVGEAYSEAGEGGSKLTEAEIIERYRQYLKSKGQDPGNRVITIDEVKNAYRDYQRKKNTGGITLIANNDLYGGSMGNSAGVSAGKAQQINITLRSMVETMNFNGNLKENAADVEANLREMLARILGMAETAA
ncbi:MAG: phage tail tape measure protein [Treponema sp.]|nr:phage tail tape measure protein [Treponema sp.]